MSDHQDKKPMFSYIPEYSLEDPLNERLLALVRFEQFLDENNFHEGMLDDLASIQSIAREKNEARIVVMSDLIMTQTRKYLRSEDS